MTDRTFAVEERPFESDFFALAICRLTLVAGSPPDALHAELGAFLASSTHAVVETNLDLEDIALASVLADRGFRLVDSRITFISRVEDGDPDFAYPSDHPDFTIRMFEERDLETVVRLTHTHLTDNPDFVSRYKDESVFGPGSARRWFDAWISDMTTSERGSTAVACVGDEVVGFFTYENRGEYADGLPLYKGILVAVDPTYRGAKLHLILQSHLFNSFPETAFYIENATQLSNYAVIKNHVRSNRRLRNCELTYMWARAG